jgi:hypothetical protein
MPNVQLKTNPALLRAIKQAATRTSTEKELRAQRISFVYGSLSASSSVTRAQVQVVIDKQEGRVAA